MMARIEGALRAAANPGAAVSMAAYMRDQFAFLGVKLPEQRAATTVALRGLPAPDEADLTAVALACWELPEREFQHVACDLLRRHVKVCGPGFLSTVKQLVTLRSWWDTVDTLAAHTTGPLVRAHPALVTTMDEWATDDNLWLARTAILHQLTYKAATDEGRLFRYCAQQLTHPDFFIRKAIGWALREYGKTAPDAVRAFVANHEDRMSGLSRREALKNL